MARQGRAGDTHDGIPAEEQDTLPHSDSLAYEVMSVQTSLLSRPGLHRWRDAAAVAGVQSNALPSAVQRRRIVGVESNATFKTWRMVRRREMPRNASRHRGAAHVERTGVAPYATAAVPRTTPWRIARPGGVAPPRRRMKQRTRGTSNR